MNGTNQSMPKPHSGTQGTFSLIKQAKVTPAYSKLLYGD